MESNGGRRVIMAETTGQPEIDTPDFRSVLSEKKQQIYAANHNLKKAESAVEEAELSYTEFLKEKLVGQTIIFNGKIEAHIKNGISFAEWEPTDIFVERETASVGRVEFNRGPFGDVETTAVLLPTQEDSPDYAYYVRLEFIDWRLLETESELTP